MKRFQFLITILISIFIFTSLVYAQPCRQKGMTGMGMGTGMCAPWLNLTAEQQTQVTELHNIFTKETTMLQKKVYKKRLEMNRLLLEDKIDTKKVFNLQGEISELTSKIDIQALKNMLEAYSVLTAEQRAQLPPAALSGLALQTAAKNPVCPADRVWAPAVIREWDGDRDIINKHKLLSVDLEHRIFILNSRNMRLTS